MKLTLLLALILLTSCASFTKGATRNRINTVFNHLIYKDSVFNNGKLKDSLTKLRINRLKKYKL